MILNLKDAFNRVHQISDEVVKEIIIYILSSLNHNLINKEEFNELKEIVKNIAIEQQKLTEEQTKLAEAQRRSEERLDRFIETTEKKFDVLIEEQRRLAEAQRKTEEEVKELTKEVKGLIEAQRRTEESLKTLIEEHKKTREQIGGLAHTVGYVLENEAYKHLPRLLERDYGIKVKGELTRKYIELGKDKYEEINIIGEGEDEGKEVIILGECKSQLKKGDIDSFINKVMKLKRRVDKREVLVIVVHQVNPQVLEYAKELGIKVYYSYQLK